MKRIPVTSSMITSIGYENGILEVEFITNGSIYQYFGVPESVYNSLMAASSHGQYFDANIKKGGYSYIKIC
jgi:hypothetical protein